MFVQMWMQVLQRHIQLHLEIFRQSFRKSVGYIVPENDVLVTSYTTLGKKQCVVLEEN